MELEGEFLSHEAVLQRVDAIRTARDRLLGQKSLVVKRSARQWRFFSDCVDRLLVPESSSEFDQSDPRQIVSLKFEVDTKLRRYYERPGQPVEFVFVLVHKRNLPGYLTGGMSYPDVGGYAVLVRPLSLDEPFRADERAAVQAEILEVVRQGAEAEFGAYRALPQIYLENIDRVFYKDGPARKEILTILYRHAAKEWVISNEDNPSTKSLHSIDLKRYSEKDAIVKTSEYWYLRWYSICSNKYVKVYRETNLQTYLLLKEDGKWKIYQNERPFPRSGAPGRVAKIH